jgi:hypothetical protein
MAITLSVKSVIIDIGEGTDTDTEIATALNNGVTYTTIYGVSIMPISNMKAKIVVIYA